MARGASKLCQNKKNLLDPFYLFEKVFFLKHPIKCLYKSNHTLKWQPASERKRSKYRITRLKRFNNTVDVRRQRIRCFPNTNPQLVQLPCCQTD